MENSTQASAASRWSSASLLRLAALLGMVGWGIAVAQHARADVPMGRNEVELDRFTAEKVLDWAPSYCRARRLSFLAVSRSLKLEQIRVVFATGDDQVFRHFGRLLFSGTRTSWMSLTSGADGQPRCIDRIEVIGSSLGGRSRLRVDWN